VKFRVSIIIPVFCEQAIINRSIAAVRRAIGGEAVEIIVVDGEAEGNTIAEIRDNSVLKLLAEKGRGQQLNRGAAAATGDVLVFLHADSFLPPVGVRG